MATNGCEGESPVQGWRLKAPHILSLQRLVSVTCLTPDINAKGGDYVLTLRLAQASPAGA
jgi:hypothetical protein